MRTAALGPLVVLAMSACAQVVDRAPDAGPADAGRVCIGGAGACTSCAWCRCYLECGRDGAADRCFPDTVPCDAGRVDAANDIDAGARCGHDCEPCCAGGVCVGGSDVICLGGARCSSGVVCDAGSP